MASEVPLPNRFESMGRRVVVTGMGLVTPLGTRVSEVWRRLCAGESGIRPLDDRPDWREVRTRAGGPCCEFSSEPYLPSHEAKKLDLSSLFALAAASDAIADSGLDTAAINPYRVGVVVGCGVGGLREYEIGIESLRVKGPRKISPFTLLKCTPHSTAAHISIKFGLRGTSYTVNSACASAAHAIGNALTLIRAGDADVVVTGGTEAAYTTTGLAGFGVMRALSHWEGDPRGASRPFDRDRTGFVLAEGAGMLVLESLEHAQSRRAEILAEVIGWGSTSDAFHIAQPEPTGIGAAEAMTLCLNDSKVAATDVDYINAHGTGTLLGDIAETLAFKKTFGEHAKKLSISSTKSQIGHLLGGSGGVELIFSILALRDGIVPPTINLDNPDPDCDLDYTPNVARERSVNVAISNSFGFGGHNVVLAVRKM
ncbi:MAG: beta-ketoacyl-ACP synthase II [Thermoguttaceae bacterium]